MFSVRRSRGSLEPASHKRRVRPQRRPTELRRSLRPSAAQGCGLGVRVALLYNPEVTGYFSVTFRKYTDSEICVL